MESEEGRCSCHEYQVGRHGRYRRCACIRSRKRGWSLARIVALYCAALLTCRGPRLGVTCWSAASIAAGSAAGYSRIDRLSATATFQLAFGSQRVRILHHARARAGRGQDRIDATAGQARWRSSGWEMAGEIVADEH